MEVSSQVHATKVTMFSMGITNNVNEDEVELIGSDPACVHVYYLTTFTDVTNFAEQIERLACKGCYRLISHTAYTMTSNNKIFNFFKSIFYSAS